MKQNKTLKDATKGAKMLGQEDIESITKIRPDLIITTKEDKNKKKLQKIAPTVQIDAMKSDYKQTTKELGEIVNEEDKANKWLSNWKNNLRKTKKKFLIKYQEKQFQYYNQHLKG